MMCCREILEKRFRKAVQGKSRWQEKRMIYRFSKTCIDFSLSPLHPLQGWMAVHRDEGEREGEWEGKRWNRFLCIQTRKLWLCDWVLGQRHHQLTAPLKRSIDNRPVRAFQDHIEKANSLFYPFPLSCLGFGYYWSMLLHWWIESDLRFREGIDFLDWFLPRASISKSLVGHSGSTALIIRA